MCERRRTLPASNVIISTKDKLLWCDTLGLPVWSFCTREDVSLAARNSLLAAHPDKIVETSSDEDESLPASPTVHAILRARRWAFDWINRVDAATVYAPMEWEPEVLNLTE